MKNKKILIIGGAGFIGHNLAIYLKKKKFDVLTVDNLKINNLAHVKKNIKNVIIMDKNDTKMTEITSKQLLTIPIHGFELNEDVKLKNNEIMQN